MDNADRKGTIDAKELVLINVLLIIYKRRKCFYKKTGLRRDKTKQQQDFFSKHKVINFIHS